tara:strand:+ start:280 stop:402 length:123 start_codon:yes stop_codon:yes gene_type:complete
MPFLMSETVMQSCILVTKNIDMMENIDELNEEHDSMHVPD